MKNICIVCDNEFESKKPADTCSNKCRQKKSRRKIQVLIAKHVPANELKSIPVHEASRIGGIVIKQIKARTESFYLATPVGYQWVAEPEKASHLKRKDAIHVFQNFISRPDLSSSKFQLVEAVEEGGKPKFKLGGKLLKKITQPRDPWIIVSKCSHCPGDILVTRAMRSRGYLGICNICGRTYV